MDKNDVIEIDLLKLMKALLKKAWLIILVAVIVAGGVFGIVKMTYVPSYTATTNLMVKGGANDTAYLSSGAATRIKTYVAFLGTQTVLEAISEEAGLGLSANAVSSKIKAEAVNSSEILAVSATGSSRENAAQLANATAEAIKTYAQMIHGEDSVVVFEAASEHTATANGSGAVQKALIAAVLAACMVCALIVAKELIADFKNGNPKNA